MNRLRTFFFIIVGVCFNNSMALASQSQDEGNQDRPIYVSQDPGTMSHASKSQLKKLFANGIDNVTSEQLLSLGMSIRSNRFAEETFFASDVQIPGTHVLPDFDGIKEEKDPDCIVYHTLYGEIKRSELKRLQKNDHKG